MSTSIKRIMTEIITSEVSRMASIMGKLDFDKESIKDLMEMEKCAEKIADASKALRDTLLN